MTCSVITSHHVVLTCVLLVSCVTVCDTSFKLVNIAVLLPGDNQRLFSLSRVTSAIELATESVERDGILTRRRLNPMYDDSKCNIANAMNAAINFYVNKQVGVYIGPCCDYAAAPVARQVKYWNVPMITAGAFAGDFGDKKSNEFQLLTRIGSSFNALAKFIMVVLKHFNWTKTNLVYAHEGHGEVMDKFCHIANNAIHHAFRTDSEVGNFTENHHKFHKTSEILRTMKTHFGKEFADDENHKQCP